MTQNTFKPSEVFFQYNNRETIATLISDGVPYTGISRCLRGDKYSREIGEGLALARAVKAAAENFEQTWLARSITKAEWNAKHGK